MFCKPVVVSTTSGAVVTCKFYVGDKVFGITSPSSHYRSSNKLRRRGGATATAETATELRSELAGRTALLAITSVASPVTALTVSPVTTATAKRPPLPLLATHHATGRSMGSLLLDVGRRHNLGRKMKPLAEVVEALYKNS